MTSVDLFSGGAAGWSQHRAVGIELDQHAVATRLARGLRTIQADVSLLDPLDVSRAIGAEVEGLCASPPCQPFSTAGKRYGFADRETVIAQIQWMGMGETALGPTYADPRSALALEPLRWALALRPRWMAFEQVPGALDIWEATAEVLRTKGYSTWTGVLNALDYGVAQTRRRAILLAHREHSVSRPSPVVGPRTLRDLFPQSDAIALRMGRARGTRREMDQAAPTIAFGKSPSGIVWEYADGSESTITVDEAATIQGFPSGLPWKGGRVAAFQQIGNAIPAPMGEALTAALRTGDLAIL